MAQADPFASLRGGLARPFSNNALDEKPCILEQIMNNNLIARASITINAPAARVWGALVNPEAIEQFVFGTHVVTDWREGSPITWKGEWQGKQYEDKGVILRFEPPRVLQHSHSSPLSGLPDEPENYHTVTIELSGEGNQTRVSLSQYNATEEARMHSEKMRGRMLTALKQFLDQTAVDPIREGFHTVTPYLLVEGAARLIDFLSAAFDAEILDRKFRPDGTVIHAELRIGDSMVMLGEASSEFRPIPASVYLYVPDCDRVYQQALAAGGESVFGSETCPQGNDTVV
ncbi:MAG: hypothetical protein KatS3mg077_0038 [Candidatus Binatia bacterium]|nr:MAG: hypothetical protein KatS3mg077_0038 [Candidatus Binatia bacterium]